MGIHSTMKLLVVLALAALACAQDEKRQCHCGAFVSMNNMELEVHRLPPIHVEDCDAAKECGKMCALEWIKFTDDGNLNHELENGLTVGGEMCRAMKNHDHPNLAPHSVYAYSMLCQGPWIFDGEVSQQMLCCKDGHYPGHCDDVTRPPM